MPTFIQKPDRTSQTIRKATRSIQKVFTSLFICVSLSFFMTSNTALAADMTYPNLECAGNQLDLWEHYKKMFMQDDGRVIDYATPIEHSTSEGQSYAMMFALINNDPVIFQKVWNWTLANLFDNDLNNNLPAWQWGKKSDDTWGVTDYNSASDADLWFAYALLEAGRIWKNKTYTTQGLQIVSLIEKREFIDLPNFGKMISTGYIKKASLNKTKWSLNPSYYPLPLLRRIAFEQDNLQWDEIVSNVPKVIKEGSPQKFPADWIYYKLNTDDIPEFYFDPSRGQKSSFDAIRVYLWAGVTHPDDPYRRDILLSISGIVRAIAIKGYVPEKIDALTGEIINNSYSPFGFSAAVAPYFYAIGKKEIAQAQINRANSMIKKSQLSENINTNKLRYYDYSLSLFGLGFTEGYYRFNLNGFLETAWMHKNCAKFDLSY